MKRVVLLTLIWGLSNSPPFEGGVALRSASPVGRSLIESARVVLSQNTLKVGVDLVNVLFTVTDHKGHLISGLNQQDFAIEEDGKKQDIQFFSHENQLPLTLGLLIDVSPSVKPTFDQERGAASWFLHQVLRPKDLAMLIEFEKSVTLAQDFTDDIDLLQRAIDQLEIGPGIDGGTSLYDALYLSAKQLKEESGRKAMIIISDGDDTTSKLKLDEAMVAVQNADCVIYSIAIGGSRFGFNTPHALGGSAGNSVMKKFSEETGGSFFRVDDQREFEPAFARINEELRNQYSIGYVSSNRLTDGKYRRIKIVPRDSAYRIQARKGYYAANNSMSAPTSVGAAERKFRLSQGYPNHSRHGDDHRCAGIQHPHPRGSCGCPGDGERKRRRSGFRSDQSRLPCL